VTSFIFDIDGTIIDSMPYHGHSWGVFLERRGVAYEGDTFLRATAGRTGTEIMRELFGPMSDDAAWALVHEKEDVYRELFAPAFLEIAGFRAFAREARRDGVLLAAAVPEPVLGELARRPAEGVGLEDVAADLRETLVDPLHRVGPREHEVLVAAFEPPEIGLREVELLERGPHRAVEDEDPFPGAPKEVGHGSAILAAPPGPP